MSKSNALENDLLTEMFNGATPDWRGDVNWYLSLHTADVGEGGDQSTNEVVYGAYARVPVDRDAGAWTVTSNQVVNAEDEVWPKRNDVGSVVATHWAIGRTSAAAGKVLYKGALAEPLTITLNIRPRILAGQLSITED